MFDITKVYVAEYSPKAKDFHADRVVDTIRHNRYGILEGAKNDYQPIGFFDSLQDALACCRMFQEMLTAKGLY